MGGLRLAYSMFDVRGGESGIPLKSDLAASFITRSGNLLVDDKGSGDATVLVPEYCDAGASGVVIYGDKTRTEEKLFDGGSYTIYTRIYQKASLTTTTASICELGSTGATRGLRLVSVSNSIRCQFSDGPTDISQVLTTDANGLVLTLPYVDVLIQIDYTAKTLTTTLYNAAGSVVGTQRVSDISAFTFDATANASNYIFKGSLFCQTNFKKFTAIKSLAQCRQDSYVTDLQLHYPCILGCYDLSTNAKHLAPSGTITDAHITYIADNTWMLDYGADPLRQFVSAYEKYLPYRTDGTKPDVWYFAGGSYRPYGEHPGNLAKHSLLPSKIRFTQAFFDRSNATIWKDAARLGYYDSSNKKDFHISELNQKTLYDWLNDGYRGMIYIHLTYGSTDKFNRELSTLDGIYLYNTDHKGNENKSILTYTKDIQSAILSGTTPTTDAEGYIALGTLKSTIPMMSFRNDDAKDDIWNYWRAYFNAKGIKPSIGIIIDSIDTAGYLTWAQLRTLQSEGWPMAFHAKTNANDYNNADEFQLLEAHIIYGIATAAANGVTITHFYGHRYTSLNCSVSYYPNKLGLKSTGMYGDAIFYTANIQALDKFALKAMANDLSGDFDFNKADHTVEVANFKAQLDLCVSDNRWAIPFFHQWTENIEDGYDQIIAYAISEGVEIMPTIDDALANCKYL